MTAIPEHDVAYDDETPAIAERERMFDPLGMKDTAFSLPASKLHRLPDMYQFNHGSKKFDVFDSAQNSEYSRPLPLNRAQAAWFRPSTTTTRSAA